MKITELVKLSEAGKSLGELIDAYTDAHKLYSFEGSSGVAKFENIVKVLGYSNVDEFLSDNSGCMDAMLEWIKQANVREWKESFLSEVGDGDDMDAEGAPA